jgi:cytoskeletal protein CcmA (bactofilin family)
MSDKTPQQTLEIGTEFEGVLRSQNPVVVSGQLTGELNAPALTLTNDGSVFGKVRVNQLRSCGTLGGEIDAESVELSGSVSDNTVIRSKTLEAKLEESDGNTFNVTFGNCELFVGSPGNQSESQMETDGNRKLQDPVVVN